jgi:hypothetical protein
MAVKHVVVPLYPEKDYRYSLSLQGESYQFRFTYNELMKLYTIAISDVNGNKIVAGVGLVPNYPILADYVIDQLQGALWMSPLADVNIEAYKVYPEDVYKYYELIYLYDDTTE